MNAWELAQLSLSGINLVLLLKIILDDLREIRTTMTEHLRDHAMGSWKAGSPREWEADE